MHNARKVIAVGRSAAVIIPPHIMDHLHAQKGDFLIFDNRYTNFCLLVKGNVPPLDQIAIDFPDALQTETADTQAHPGTGGQHDSPVITAFVPLGVDPPDSPGPLAESLPP
jgi:hypothetical protein